MNPANYTWRPSVIASLILGLAAQSSAQNAPVAEDTIVLDPFSVSTTAIDGYTATQTTTGARIAADIKQLAFTVDVAPVEFYDDFSLFDETEQLALVPGLSPSESKGDYQLRGISGSNFLRNGFLRFGVTDKTNIDRIEVIKGPAAAIYGKTLPGGIVNVISKQAKNRPEYDVEVQGGGLDLWRAQVNLTGPIVPNVLLYRIDASAYHELAYEQFRENEHDNLSGQLVWIPSSRTRVTLEVDRALNYRGARDGVVWARDKQTKQYLGLAWDHPNFPRDFNTSGPNTYTNISNSQVDLSVFHRINDALSLRASGNWYKWRLFTIRGTGVFDPDDSLIWDRRPDLGYEPRDGHALNLDLFSEFKIGRTDHKLLVTLDMLSDKRVVGPTYRLDPLKYRTANGFPGTERLMEYTISNPDFIHSYPPDADFNNRFRWQETTNDIIGMLVNDRITLLDERLMISLGGRWDSVKQEANDRHKGNVANSRVDDFTVQSGVNYNVTRALTFYGNYSTSFFPQSRLDQDGNPFPNQEGAGYDFGAKFDLAGGRIFVVANYFDLEYRNIVQQESDPNTGAAIFTLNGLTESEGFELNLGGRLAEGLMVKVGAAYVDATIADNQAKALIGLPPRRVPERTLGAALKYEVPSGPMKDVFVGMNVTYQSGNRITDSTAGNRHLYRIDGFTRYDLTLGYKWKPKDSRFRHTVALTAKNLFDREYLYGSDPTPGNPRQIILRYALAFR